VKRHLWRKAASGRAPRAPERVITSAGLLARGSSIGRAFPGCPSGIVRRLSPPTVAGAAADLDRVPFSSGREPGTEGPLCIDRQGALSRPSLGTGVGFRGRSVALGPRKRAVRSAGAGSWRAGHRESGLRRPTRAA